MKTSGIITLLSPLSHTEQNEGTFSLFRRMTIFLDGEEYRVPILSGNSIRGQLRRALMADLLKALDLTPADIGDDAYYTLFVGGRLKKAQKAKAGGIQPSQVRELIPALSILGSVVGQRIMPGKLICGMAVPITKETTEMTGIESEVSIYSLTEEIPYSRRDDLEEKQKESVDKAQMQYHIEGIKAGTRLAHFFALSGNTDIETAAFWRGVRLLAESGHLGGMRSKGHGRFVWSYEVEDETAYANHLKKNGAVIKEMIMRFGDEKAANQQ